MANNITFEKFSEWLLDKKNSGLIDDNETIKINEI